ncbi:MAG TPA: hypothetical protein VFV34_24300 [Blastocatellia bacterium]|nr:hypothetical protein [Blastocatellia bacterium]
MKLDRRDLLWIALIAVSFVAGLAISWERWGNPLVDCGREMNQPLRLAGGQMLYSDVRHIYGPLSPYVNAALFKVFTPSLGVLYADGIITAALILILIYYIARQIMTPASAGAATLSVLWLCALKQAGNYILPYSYSALHGCALGLITLALLLKFLRLHGSGATRAAFACLALAGVAAGAAVLAKTEMGTAAVTAGIAAGVVGIRGYRWRAAALLAFVAPAAAVAVSVYAVIAARVGWQTLVNDSHLFFASVPPELVYFNKRMFGFDRPLQSLIEMISAALKVGLAGALIATVSMALARRNGESVNVKLVTADAGLASLSQLIALACVSALLLVSLSLAAGSNVDRGPYLAMPILLVVLAGTMLARTFKESVPGASREHAMLVAVTALYALASLARVLLRVRSGGAYSSYLLPASVVLFTYSGAHVLPGMIRDARAGRLAHRIFLALILVWLAATAVVFSVRYRRYHTYQISTSRGVMIALPDLGKAFDEAIQLINSETAPGEPIGVVPEGTSLTFLTDRTNPLREEIVTPGYLNDAGEQRAIEQLQSASPKLIFVTNRATPEFGPAVIGGDYCVRLMGWVEQNYDLCAVLGPEHKVDLEIGNKLFFIRAYRRRAASQPSQAALLR